MWSSVELREVRVFLTVAEELHFGRAADRLQINRSRVSQIVSELEVKVGGRLFDRTSRRVQLTATGEQLRESLAQPYAELERGFLNAREVAAGVTGTVRIGSYLAVNAGPRITDIVHTFRMRHPACEVDFVDTGLDRSYLDALRRSEVDMLAARLPLTAPDITIGPILSTEERVLMVAKHDPLAQRDSISYDDIAGRAITDSPTFPRETMDAFVPPVTPSGHVLKRIVTTSIDEALMRVALAVQVHPTVSSFVDHLNHPGITSVPIRDLPPSKTALVWLSTNRSQKVAAFASAAADVLATAPGHQLRNMTIRHAGEPATPPDG
jgi:DNA-binding transcriptional LysR family regulator